MTNHPPTSELPAQPVLRVQSLYKQYIRGRRWGRGVTLTAVCNVDLEIYLGHTLALVGSSGAGKSTVARCVTRMERPDSGQIWLDGSEIAQARSRDLLSVRPKIHMIFQDAVTSMNPRFSAAEVIEEPLRIQGASRSERRDISAAVM